jgi:hypothetical protein
MPEAYVYMPNAFPNVITARACTRFSSTLSRELDPCILFKVPDTFGEEACSYEVKKACGHHEEDLQRSFVAAFVDEKANQCACTEAANDSKGKACRWSTEANTCNKSGFLFSQERLCENWVASTYSTASIPSRSTVTNGKMNMAYFSVQRFNLPLTGRLRSFCSSTLEILTRHLSCSLLTRSKAAPINVMMTLARIAKTPSQMFSAASKVFFPAV